MTAVQQKIVRLACGLCEGRLIPDDIPAGDWELLLEAADLHNPHSLPQIVSHRVLRYAQLHRGYFAPHGTPPASSEAGQG
jgi:hypothetical protein